MLHNDPFHGGFQLRYHKGLLDWIPGIGDGDGGSIPIPGIGDGGGSPLTTRPEDVIPLVKPLGEGLGGSSKKGGGGDISTEFIRSPESQRILEGLFPTIEKIGAAGAAGTSPWDIPTLNVPDYRMMMPTEEIMAGISPEVKAGVMAPYKETEQQLLETLGAGGGLGSARGGFSGQGATGVGKYWADVAPEYTKSLWGMTSPALQAGYGTGVGASMQQWQQELEGRKYPFQAGLGLAGASMPTPVVQQPSAGKK